MAFAPKQLGSSSEGASYAFIAREEQLSSLSKDLSTWNIPGRQFLSTSLCCLLSPATRDDMHAHIDGLDIGNSRMTSVHPGSIAIRLRQRCALHSTCEYLRNALGWHMLHQWASSAGQSQCTVSAIPIRLHPLASRVCLIRVRTTQAE